MQSHELTGEVAPGRVLVLVRKLAGKITLLAASQHETRLHWLPVWLGCGIAAHFALPWASGRLVFDLTLILLIAIAGFATHWRPGWLLIGFLLCLAGGLRLEQRIRDSAAPRLERPTVVVLEAIVLSSEMRTGERQRLIVAPISASRSLPALQRIRLTQMRAGERLMPGDRIRSRIRLSPPPGPSAPGGFDRARRDWFLGIGAQGIILGPLLRTETASRTNDPFATLRQSLSQRMQASTPGDAGAVAAAMITGDATPLSAETEQALQVTSLYHLLSVSGFHLAILTGLVFLIVRHGLAFVPRLALDWPLKEIAALASIVTAILYTLFTGAAWPTVRACIAVCVVMAALLLRREPFNLRIIALAALLILLWRPEALVNISFQFSFAAIGGLVAALQSPWGQYLSRGRGEDHPAVWLLRKIAAGAWLSLGAEAAIAPIALLHFHQLGIYGIAANALAAPLATYLIMPLGMASAVLAPFGADGWLAPALAFACNALLAVAHTLAAWPSARLLVPDLGVTTFALATAATLMAILMQGRLRALSLLPAALALLFAATHSAPDLRIAGDGRQVMLNSGRGAMLISNEHGGATLRDRWREDFGRLPEWTWAQGGLGYGITEGTPRCGDNGCRAVLERRGRLWRIAVFGPDAAPRACPAADLLIDGRDIRKRTCTAPVYLDRRSMSARGVTDLTLHPSGVRFRSDRSLRGDRPWARNRWGDPYSRP